jgi:hypothetical protein
VLQAVQAAQAAAQLQQANGSALQQQLGADAAAAAAAGPQPHVLAAREQQLWDRQLALLDATQQQWQAERQVRRETVCAPAAAVCGCCCQA